MTTPNPNSSIIVPASYDHELTILYDSRTGKSELRSKKPLNELIMAGLLAANASAIINNLIMNAKSPKGVKV